MSRDSTPTYLHLHHPHHADLFEEFCRPPSSTSPTSSTAANPTSTHQNGTTNSANGEATTNQHIPGSFLPYEEIHLPPHLMPLNPEDEDGVVPDMHAAFGINRALNQHSGAGGVFNGTGLQGGGERRGENSGAGVVREAGWRDLGLEGILDGNGGERGGGWGGEVVGGVGRERGAGGVVNGVGAVGRVSGARREGRRTGVLLLR